MEKVSIDNNYFDYFGLETKFDIDMDELDSKYLNLQYKNHPDSYDNHTQKINTQHYSILLNEAYHALKSPLKRAEYLLSLFLKKCDIMKPSPELLMEVFEMREQAKQNDPFLSATYDNCIEKIKEAFSKNNFIDMAYHTMRLKYITKVRDDICN